MPDSIVLLNTIFISLSTTIYFQTDESFKTNFKEKKRENWKVITCDQLVLNMGRYGIQFKKSTYSRSVSFKLISSIAAT